MATKTYRVTGMSCHHCELSVTEEVSEVPGITVDSVSAQTGLLTVSAADAAAIDDNAIIAAVSEAGYDAAVA